MLVGEFILNKIVVMEIIIELTVFYAYIFVCASFLQRRFSRLVTAVVFGIAGIVVTVLQIAIMMSSGETLALTMLPLTLYLPFSVLLYFLSDSGIFETAAVCSVGTLGVLILRALRKILTVVFKSAEEHDYNNIIAAAVIAAAAALVFVSYKYIGKAFRSCIVENRQNRRMLSIGVSICLPIIMMHYYLNSTAEVILLILTMLIALSIFFIIAKLMIQAKELIYAKRAEKELSEYIDVQRRGYDRAVRKMEAVREYRHDMRHHLAVIEGLAKKGDCDKIIEYTSNLSGSIGSSERADCCKNPELNALLSEYISRAENAGCRVKHRFVLPETLSFEVNDVCLVLANAVENAINANSMLPEDKRYINITAEYKDGQRLLVSVENPCLNDVEFDENGLPVIEKRSDEHGIGLRSAKRIVEKYNGFLRCVQINGKFIFHAALFRSVGAAVHNEKRPKLATTLKRTALSLACLCLGEIIMMNVLPSAAEAASSLLSINIRTVRNFNLGWGDNSIKIDAPEFSGKGSDELNGAVKSYTDEAKEKFMWYFNRRHNGYVAEDMRYTVIRDDEKYFIAQFNTTINAGGSMDYGRWIVFDKTSGKVLELSDLFKDGSDYIGVLSTEILAQMKFKNEHENGKFFIEGNDAFTEISEDANFYFDSFDRLVIVFDEYEVAPGYMGSPEFIITKKAYQDIAV